MFNKATIALTVAMIALPMGLAFGQIAGETYIIDKSTVSTIPPRGVPSIYVTDLGLYNPAKSPGNPPSNGNALVATVLAYEVKHNAFSTNLLESNTAISRTLDLSNLEIYTYLGPNADRAITQPLTLTSLAKTGGFDHFNFVQQITHEPTGFSYIEQNLATGEVTYPGIPQVDPLLSGASTLTPGTTGSLLYGYSAASNVEALVANYFGSDKYNEYYNEDFDFPFPSTYKSFVNASDTSIKFFDKPATLSSFVSLTNYDDYTGFVTSLVGVATDPSVYTEWSGIGTQMTWISNTNFQSSSYSGGDISNLIYLSNPYLDGPQPDGTGNVTGGISIIRYDLESVPEPSSFVLSGCGIGVVTCLAAIKRRKKVLARRTETVLSVGLPSILPPKSGKGVKKWKRGHPSFLQGKKVEKGSSFTNEKSGHSTL